jgi:hypothetical protein
MVLQAEAEHMGQCFIALTGFTQQTRDQNDALSRDEV